MVGGEGGRHDSQYPFMPPIELGNVESDSEDSLERAKSHKERIFGATGIYDWTVHNVFMIACLV